jgi:ATP-dependent phosphofructokinase / diphosphate-dependent phosphofructokinase
MKTLAILTNGGDTCSLNAAIKNIRDHGIAAGYTRILGFEDGYLGVVNKSVKLLTWEPIDPQQGGTILRSQRFAPTSDEERQVVFQNLSDMEVSALVVIGGDGTLAATKALWQSGDPKRFGVRILGFPRTIDNDIRTNTFEGETEVAICPGYPSAAIKIARLTRELRTTAMSSRKIFVLETMGRDAGWLAAATSLGGAEFVLIPEIEFKEDDWNRFYERAAKLYAFHGHVIIGVSEGFRIGGIQEMDAAFGPRKLGGVGVKVAKMVEEGIQKLGLNVAVRYQQAGYIPRMGAPCPYDIEFASVLGAEIGAMLEDGSNGELPVSTIVPTMKHIGEGISRIPLSKVEQFFLPATKFYDFDTFSITDSFIDLMKKFVDPRGL